MTARMRALLNHLYEHQFQRPQRELIRAGFSKRLIAKMRFLGLVTVRPNRTGKHGRPENLVISKGQEPPPVQVVKRPVAKDHCRRAILEAIGDGEVTLGDVARRVGRSAGNISGTMLIMCSLGILVRRRTLGVIDGRTSKREWYSYRRA